MADDHRVHHLQCGNITSMIVYTKDDGSKRVVLQFKEPLAGIALTLDSAHELAMTLLNCIDELQTDTNPALN